MSLPIITFEKNGSSIDIRTPQFGYLTEIHLAMVRGERLGDGKFKWFDHGKTYDWRLFFPRFILAEADQKNLQDFFSDDTKGRGQDVGLIVPKGIFPFGPDKGDGRRKFRVQAIDMDFGGAGRGPWLNFNSSMVFVLAEDQTYHLSQQVHEDNVLQIGPVDRIRFPPDWYHPKTKYRVNTNVTYGGEAHSIDATAGGDYQETTFRFVGNQTKAGAVLYYLVNSARSNDFSVTVQKNSYLFGRDNTDTGANKGGGVYTTNLIDNTIVCRHDRFNLFSFELALSYKAFAAL